MPSATAGPGMRPATRVGEVAAGFVPKLGDGALYLGDDLIRAIGFFNSSAEYQRVLAGGTLDTLIAELEAQTERLRQR